MLNYLRVNNKLIRIGFTWNTGKLQKSERELTIKQGKEKLLENLTSCNICMNFFITGGECFIEGINYLRSIYSYDKQEFK